MSQKIVPKNKTIDPNESELNALFREVIDGLRDDLAETQAQADMYFVEITNRTDGKDVYGPAYDAALKTKGQARDRMLKFVGLFKERVTKKEDVKLKQESTQATTTQAIDHEGMNRMLEDMTKNGQLANIDLSHLPKYNDDEEEDDDTA